MINPSKNDTEQEGCSLEWDIPQSPESSHSRLFYLTPIYNPVFGSRENNAFLKL